MLVKGVDALNHERFNNQLGHNCDHACVGEIMEADGVASIAVSGGASGSSLKKKSSKESKSWSIFSPKKSRKATQLNSSNDEAMARFVNQLVSEGRSADNISTHLSCLRDVDAAPLSPNQQQKKKSSNPFSRFAKALTHALKDEMQAQQYYNYPPPAEAQFLTISISAAPFFAACPPDMDVSFDEFSTLEPMYNGNNCINLLPVTKYDGTPLPGDQTTCAVCLCEFEEKEELKSLPCVHFYHKECIDRWLMVGHNCPMCKALVL